MSEHKISKDWLKSVKKDKRLTPMTQKNAKDMENIVGTSKLVPQNLKKEINSNPSKSDALRRMKNYIKNK